jgi:hypothetical protein
VPAAEWLLDNYHLVEAQIREIRDDLPVGYYRQLPKLAEGPFAGYPRVFGLAWAFVAHTDSHFDPAALRRFIAAYQRVQPLTIGELWAGARAPTPRRWPTGCLPRGSSGPRSKSISPRASRAPCRKSSPRSSPSG